MRARSRIDLTLKTGFLVLVIGSLIAACGSISVIDSDASTGTGGVPGGGMGGGHGGAAGGNSGSGGAAGVGGRGGGNGAGGSNGGGAIGGRTGATGGTSGGGAGGTQGGVGGTSGGLGGGNGGLGGASGQGGASGGLGGGNGGLGGRGGGVTCQDLQRDFALALAAAKMCTLGARDQCTVVTDDRLDCGCPTSVNDTDKIAPIRDSWVQNGCSSRICTAVLCTGVSSGACAATTGSQPTCQDLSSVPQPI
jgi:hypothetical protein